MEWPSEKPVDEPALTPQSKRPARAISKAMPRFFLATGLPGAATFHPRKIPPTDQRPRAVRNLRFSYRSGHAVDLHISPGSAVPNPVSRCSPAGSRQAGWTALCGTCGNRTSFTAFKLAVRVRHPYSWLETRWLVRLVNESPPTAREQNAWQDGAFRFRLRWRSRRHPHDRTDDARAAHSSPRAQEYAQNARGHRGQDSSQALGQVISLDSCSRTSKLEPRSQKTRVGALERKNFSQSKSLWPFARLWHQKSPLHPLGVRVTGGFTHAWGFVRDTASAYVF